jgi:DNA-binding PadR family transcriptional regulator
MEDRGWVAAEWGLSGKGKRAKFYRLTPQGRAQLRTRVRDWERYVASIGKVLRAAPQPA